MALIVEDGTGIANAESLASVAFADDYHLKRGNAGWAAVSTTGAKEELLRKATDYFVGMFGLILDGALVSTSQALPFPRIINTVNVGNPLTIQQGIAELALIAKTVPLVPSVTRGKKRVKVGPIEVEYDGNSPVATQFTAAVMRFAPYLLDYAGNGINVNLVRC